jgi:hypothetical protein
MSKTYKRREKGGKKEKKGKEGKRKGRKTYKIRKPKKKTRFQSQGFMKTMMSNGSERDIEWNNQYDGKKADLNLWTNLNGKKEKYHIQMNNQEIERLLSQPSVEQRLDKRLIKDFSMD